MKKTMALVMALAAASLVTSDLIAQEPAPAETTLLEEATQLNRTLAQIASLLQKHVESQDSELLIKRIELSGRRLIPMKERLRKANTELADLESQEADIVGMLEAQKEEMARDGGAAEADPYQVMSMEQMERRVEAIPGKTQELAREIMELENDVAVHEEDLKILEEVIDARLGLR